MLAIEDGLDLVGLEQRVKGAGEARAQRVLCRREQLLDIVNVRLLD